MSDPLLVRLFCRNEWGDSNWGAEWSNTPFRYGDMLYATNGHLIVWREATRRDDRYPLLEKDRPKKIREGHPGAGACRRKWPSAKSTRHSWTIFGTIYSVRVEGCRWLYINAVYRDRVASFGRKVGAPVRCAVPSDYDKPIYFVCGRWSGALMCLAHGPESGGAR